MSELKIVNHEQTLIINSIIKIVLVILNNRIIYKLILICINKVCKNHCLLFVLALTIVKQFNHTVKCYLKSWFLKIYISIHLSIFIKPVQQIPMKA